MAHVAVMGAGSWGTAFAALTISAGSDVRLWARRREVADEVNGDHSNHEYLADAELPEQLLATDDPQEALQDAAIVVVAVPSTHVVEQLQQWGGAIPDGATLVSLIKGVDVATHRFGSETIAATLDIDPTRVVVVSGPNLARECVAGQPAATVAASATTPTAPSRSSRP